MQKELGRHLAAQRKQRKRAQKQVAEALGLPRTAISQIENGNRAISTLEIVKLARLYRCEVNDLIPDSLKGESK